MSDIGFSDQVPSLPGGGGNVAGIGATFTPDLSTGTGGLLIPIDTPNGPNDIGPRLNLQYSSAAGNGPFGLGFSITLPRLLIDTEYGFPNYDGNDPILLEGAGQLLALGGGVYRPRVDGGAWRIQKSGSGFTLMTRDGAVYALGVDAAARLADPANPANIFAWYLESIVDALGYTATFTWRSDRGQLYLDTIAYGAYKLVFTYQARADAFRSGRSGFTITTGLRCTQIELQLVGDPRPAVRRWTLAYTADAASGASLLTTITLSGLDEKGVVLAAPPLKLGYPVGGQPSLVRLAGDGIGLPALTLGPSRRADLIDWDGNGLPDVMQIGSGGEAYVWRNTGNATFQGPQTAGLVPGFALANAALAFADMDGDGLADLIRYDQPLAGYVPRLAGGGFGEPVSFQQAPAPVVASPGIRVVDLNGDGIPDMLTSSDSGLTLYYRAGAEGWSAVPRVVPKGVAPDVDLIDPQIFLADMTGDGSNDMVRVSGGGITYWPYLGDGRWDTPVLMANSPSLPFDVRLDRVFVSDVNGDGIADIIYLDSDRVTYWVNQAGLSFGPPVNIDYVPTAAIQQPRLADMTGTGTAGILWTSNGPFGEGTQYFYLDFLGSVAPRLLSQIDNGIGLLTTVEYTTSAQEAARAMVSGSPWSTTLPIPVPVVKKMTIADQATGTAKTSTFAYRDGRYDGVLREFAGFGQVDQQDQGDAGIPTLLTSSWFHIGVDPAQPQAALDDQTQQSLRAIRGRIYKRERYGQDGSPSASNLYDRSEYNWTVVTVNTAGGPVFVPRLATTIQSVIERGAAPVSTITNANNSWDANGNVIDTTETAKSGTGAIVQTLRTQTTYATDPGGRFLSKPFRVQQSDGTGAIVADQVMVYDNAAEGQTGTQGLLTRRLSLVITDATATAAYGAATPDFLSYHYYRRADSQGWWIDQGRYVRTVNASGLSGTVEGPNGGTFNVVYDANQTFPIKVADPAGNVVTATYDYRASRVATLTDASGQTFSATFDALARLVARVEPGDTAALPTFAFTYDTSSVPPSTKQSLRATSGSADTVDRRIIYGGDGRELEIREVDELGEISVLSRLANARVLLAHDYVAFRPASSAYSVPGVAVPSTAYTYDALGRQLTRTDPDGNVTSWTIAPGSVQQVDANGKITSSLIDATGRIVTMQEQLSGSTLTSSYLFDVKGNLLQHTDAAGNVVKMWFDCLGHVLRVQRPERDTMTVFDAAGNPVETRTQAGITLVRTYDTCNRPVTVAIPGQQPSVRYTYDDTGSPPPPDAGAHTAGGRCVRIDDESGVSIFDYDVRGRTLIKRSTPTGASQYVLTFAYRSDGQLASLTYPTGKGASLVLGYQYGKRGLVSTIPGVVSSISYDLQGRRTSVSYANGVTTAYACDNAGRLTQLDHSGPAGSLRATQLVRDAVGNLTQIVSPDNNIATTFFYDDLHRLVRAATVAGDARTYAYDNAGNFTSKSDVGDYAYGENGLPATCLTTAGAAKFTYTALGEMLQTPWGTQTFDAFGRLTGITGTTQAAFTYNYSGARMSASFTSGGKTTTRLTPDSLYALEDGTLVNYLFDGRRLVARDVDGGARMYLHEDHVGSIVLMTDATGAVSDAIRYDPFGGIVARQVAASTVPVGFAFGTFDDASGLLYLHSRYYHPHFGRFVSPDSIVPNIFVPAAWNSYAYCANNPQTYADPSGRAWWQILVAVLAIVALVALTIVTFGAFAPAAAAGSAVAIAAIITVSVGVVAGGIIGGIAAYKAGGSAGDIILGVLVGAAVGGWASFGANMAGGAIGAALGTTSKLLADVVAGAAAGAINGAAMGFAAGFAGGKGTLDQTLADIALGALVGAVVGGALGLAQFALTGGAPPTPPNTNAGQTPPGPPPDPAGGVQNPPLGSTNSPGSAAITAGGPYAGFALQVAGRAALSAPFTFLTEAVIVDSASGILDLGYGPQILQWLEQNNITISKSGSN